MIFISFTVSSSLTFESIVCWVNLGRYLSNNERAAVTSEGAIACSPPTPAGDNWPSACLIRRPKILLLEILSLWYWVITPRRFPAGQPLFFGLTTLVGLHHHRSCRGPFSLTTQNNTGGTPIVLYKCTNSWCTNSCEGAKATTISKKK